MQLDDGTEPNCALFYMGVGFLYAICANVPIVLVGLKTVAKAGCVGPPFLRNYRISPRVRKG